MVDKRDVRALYTLASQAILSRVHTGKNVFDDDWDLLVVLDACRVDALRSVSDEYDWLPERIDSVWSCGSTSKEWVERTFTQRNAERIGETGVVSSNPFMNDLQSEDGDPFNYNEFEDTFLESGTDRLTPLIRSETVRPEDFALFDSMWEERGDFAHDSYYPDNVTEHAIWVGRNRRPDRCLVHYMQPHSPFFATADSYDELTEREKSPFAAIKSGEHSREQIYEEYLDNLRFVLERVKTLLHNYDAEKVVITADHGELFGEWGLYGHHAGVFHPALRKVPWAVTSATDTGSVEPALSEDDIISRSQPSSEQLQALGYV